MKSTIFAATAIALGLVAGCAQTVPTAAPTADGFKTQQVLIGDGGPYGTAAAGLVNPLVNPFDPLFSLVNTSPWFSVIPQYSTTLIGAGFPFYGGLGYGNWYGDYGGYGGGYGGRHGGGRHRGGIAEQNSVAYRPAGSRIWKPK